MGPALFYLYALIACGAAIAVVLSQNVVRMAFWLVVSLSSVSFLFFMLGADFVGATQLLIYVGGTVVLLIFGVMLTSSGPFKTIKNSSAEMALSGMIGIAFLAVVSSSVFSVDWTANNYRLAGADAHHNADHGHAHSDSDIEYGYNPETYGNTTRSLGTALLGVRFDKDFSPEAAAKHTDADHAHDDHIHGDHSHGEVTVSTGYLLPFEIVSVHLLVVLIGAAYLARAKRRVDVQQA